MPALVDIFLAAEGAFERELAALAIFQPQTIANLDIRPEINQAAIAFFKKFDKRKDEILAADDLTAIKIACECCEKDDWYRFYAEIYGVNTFIESQKFGPDLIALRTVRKALMWIQESGVLQRGIYDG